MEWNNVDDLDGRRGFYMGLTDLVHSSFRLLLTALARLAIKVPVGVGLGKAWHSIIRQLANQVSLKNSLCAYPQCYIGR